MDFPKVTRVEVIGPTGRIHACYGSAEIVLQDDDRTLKLFISSFDEATAAEVEADHRAGLTEDLRRP